MSGKIIELDLFVAEEEKRELDENAEFRKMVGRSIRGLFARNNENERVILEMHKRVDQLTEMVMKNG